MLIARALRAVRRRVARPILHGLRRPVLLRRMSRASEVRLLGLRFRTHPDVFHPVYFSSSRILAEALLGADLRGRSFLDMGTGSGPIALVAAKRGARVTACDVNARAVLLTRTNAALNGLSVEVIESDLFSSPLLEGRTFDEIVFNVPFYPHPSRSVYERAFRAGEGFDVVRRFAEGARAHLGDQGRVVIIFSEDCDREPMLGAFLSAGFALEEERLRHRALEQFSVTSFRVPATGVAAHP
jgi:release factor glutamine methyltransferase